MSQCETYILQFLLISRQFDMLTSQRIKCMTRYQFPRNLTIINPKSAIDKYKLCHLIILF